MEPEGPLVHHQEDQHAHCGSPRKKERNGKRKNNVSKLPKFRERREYKHPRNSTNSKQGRFKETYTEAHYNQTVASQSQRENLESHRELHTMESPVRLSADCYLKPWRSDGNALMYLNCGRIKAINQESSKTIPQK